MRRRLMGWVYVGAFLALWAVVAMCAGDGRGCSHYNSYECEAD